MKLLGFNISRETRSANSPENPSVPVSDSNFLAFFGLQSVNLPSVTIESALTVPAVLAAVTFLSRTMAAIPRHAYRRTKDGAERMIGRTAMVLHENPNPLMDKFKFDQWFWQQVFTGGRGLAWIERNGNQIEALWPMNPRKTTIRRSGFSLVYKYENKEYSAEDVIDVPFMLKEDQISHRGPIAMATKAIQLAIAMNDYGSTFFAGGGVPPLALTGAGATGKNVQRALADVHDAIQEAKKSSKPIFPVPPGHELNAVGIDPEKGQMTDARRFQVEEIARSWQLPPVFLQDLTRATLNNAEQQDLHLVKHLIGQWVSAYEGEMNLKLFGRFSGRQYVEHNLDGLMRGDFKSRIEGIARGIQTGQLTPNEARALENRPKHKNPSADELLVQGATVVLGQQPAAPAKSADDIDGDKNDDNA
ncbi:phage portal protein [Rhizobium sp. GN54]|uniref:phage portal protein n=1 Tax=Rhizobium sp. GN54 TaxID=2898150 RepID=UPI001E561211|nr:phage portal protein [Rhizobium sp. GN54]MCD2183328.1 phage portal protein [Rhizobium sp. GN54]